MPSKATHAETARHRTARKTEVRVHFQNTPQVIADGLVRQVSSLQGTTVSSVKHSRVAYKLGPHGIPWVSIFISVKPYAYGAGLYVSKKLTDLLFEPAKDWLKNRKTQQARKVYILGPDSKVIRCVQINGDQPEDVMSLNGSSAELSKCHSRI